MSYASRLAGEGEESPASLVANPKNWRAHPENQRRALDGILTEVGWVQRVLVNRRTGFILDGHLRVALAAKRGEATLPVQYVDVDEREEAILLSSLDPIAALAEADKDALGRLAAEWDTDNEDVLGLLRSVERDYLAQRPRISEEQVAEAEERASRSPAPERARAGDVWALGRHRVWVGDSRLLRAGEGPLAELGTVDGVFTSPPYADQRTYGGHVGSGDWSGLVPDVLTAAIAACSPQAQVFVNLGLAHEAGRVVRYWDVLLDGMERRDWSLVAWYVWDKLGAIPGDYGGRFSPAHEWVFHFAREQVKPLKVAPTAGGNRRGGTRRDRRGGLTPMANEAKIREYKVPDSVVRLPAQRPDPLVSAHPAPFPVGLPSAFMAAWPLETWLDPFFGAGTTMIAAHALGLTCVGVEIEPSYADLALARYEALSGEAPELISRDGGGPKKLGDDAG